MTTSESSTASLAISPEEIREACQGITRQIDREYMAECGRNNESPKRLWDAMAETGILGVGVPEQYGGLGGTLSDVALVLDLLGEAGLFPVRFLLSQMVRATLIKHGSDWQKERWLTASASGDIHFSFALTEADAGTNSFKIRTRAERQASGDFVLNGSKMWITGAHEADLIAVVARTSAYDPASRKSGMSIFMVDTKSEGFSLAPIDIGIHMADLHWAVHFDNLKVPAENIVGHEGMGLEALFDILNPERLLAAALNVGITDFILNKTADYARMRAPFGVPIGQYQGVQLPMAQAKSQNEGARALTYKATNMYDVGENPGRISDMARFLSVEAMLAAANIAMNTHGGSALDMSQDVIPFYLYAKFQDIAPINRNVCLATIAERAFDLPKSY